jgi:hypothetical protein
MEILDALKQEESKLHRKLMAVQGAVAALNAGSMTAVTVSPSHTSSTDGAVEELYPLLFERGYLERQKHDGRRSGRRKQKVKRRSKF